MGFKRSTVLASVGLVLAGAVLGSVTALAVGFGNSGSSPSSASDSIGGDNAQVETTWPQVVDKYDVNSKGETIGILGQTLASDPNSYPQLFAAVATNGNKGWVYFEEAIGKPATTLEEARNMPAPVDKTVSVYDLEGKVIGEFRTSNG